MKIIECKPGFPGIPDIKEHKVAGEVYVPAVSGKPAIEPSFIVSMTQEELNLIATVVGGAVGDSVSPADHVWQTLRPQIRSSRFIVVGSPYTIRRSSEL